MGGSPAPLGAVHLGIDVGTSNTAAALRGRGQEIRPVLFDGALLLPSAVFVDGDTALVGLDARHAGATRPALLEPNPKRCIDDRFVLLGEQEVPVERLLAAILARVRDAATQLAGPVDAVTLSYPATWGARRLATLTTAARLAGLPTPTTIHEPVSAAAHFVRLPEVELAEGQPALVYDLGAGTFDATVIRRTGDGFDVVASQGLSDAGGLDIDAAIMASVSANLRPDDDGWRYLRQPRTPADLRNRRLLTDGVRAAKEMLSRTSMTSIYVPVLDAEVPLGREQFETLARPLLDRTVAATRAVLRDAHVAEEELSAILLVGGSTRIPLVGTLLHQALGRAPVALDQPELAVAYGAVAHGAVAHGAVAVDRAMPVTRGLPAGQAAPGGRAAHPATAPPRQPAAVPLRAGQLGAVPLRAGPRGRWRWSGAGFGRWSAAGLGLLLVAAIGVVYQLGPWSDRSPTGPADASTSRSPSSTGASTPTSPTPGPSTAVADAVPAVPAPFVGEWIGKVSQPGGVVTSWSVSVTFRAGSDVGTFRSSSLGCRGTLTVVAPRPTEREMHLRQRTTSDPKSICVDAADWTLIALDNGKIDMFWQQFGNPVNAATATLSRS
ncbi:Hsp70 family protein [Plantactinospora sp. WMMB334]|uniref:Hsp70 family protein n=1 Tax=Plantactinospora sp. WMMB334 TaxID=3404119 RepID=UPI003B94DCCB